MLHVYACFGRPWPYPKRLVDAALQLQRSDGFWAGGTSSCADLVACMRPLYGSQAR